MASILLFNPENDLALAAGTKNFTPGKEPLKLSVAGAYLPFWWAGSDDLIIAPPLTEQTRAMIDKYDLAGEIIDDRFCNDYSSYELKPWGWSFYSRNIYQKILKGKINIPDDNEINRLRDLSHRRITVKIHDFIGTDANAGPIEAYTVEEAKEIIKYFKNDAVIKLPWSSSGRGVFMTWGLTPLKLDDYIRGFIRHQGSLMIEPRHANKIKDFALLFYCENRKAVYKGLSVFVAGTSGGYSGNIVASDEVLASEIGVDINLIPTSLSQAIDLFIAPYYNGWLGIDMMLVQNNNGEKKIIPCVEVNLRMTMGVLAHYIARNKCLSGERYMLFLSKNIDSEDVNLSPVKDGEYYYLLRRQRL